MKKKSSLKIVTVLLFILIASVAAAAGVYMFSGEETNGEISQIPDMSLDD
ncbi:MAG: hypothetical protein HFG67_02690, partial [Firmicutes bacterium]|nr:hypothetical protein [Bacillota bacterium]